MPLGLPYHRAFEVMRGLLGEGRKKGQRGLEAR